MINGVVNLEITYKEYNFMKFESVLMEKMTALFPSSTVLLFEDQEDNIESEVESNSNPSEEMVSE